MSFRITGLAPDPFRHLFGMTDEELAKHGAKRYVADTKPGFPDRIELRDAEPGETVILLNSFISRPITLTGRATRSSCVKVPKSHTIAPTTSLTQCAHGSYRCGHSMPNI